MGLTGLTLPLLFFCGMFWLMTNEDFSYLSEAEAELKKSFSKVSNSRMPSTASDLRESTRVGQLILRDEERGKMPYTKDKFIVKENPHLVQWEREVRKFLRNLSPEHGHRVTAVMIWEWATGINLVELIEKKEKPRQGVQSWRSDMIKINKVLKFYFGDPYMTWIMGRKVGKAYRVKPGYYIRRHRPMTLSLYAEYAEGVLYP